jgi:polyisoprenoid-binding protein YceI
MSLEAGTHRFGPDNASLSVKTGRTGAAAKAGHDLVLGVKTWQGTLEVGEDPARTTMELKADATSLRVQRGTGGMKALDDDDKANIHQTIDDEVLRRRDIVFRSTRVQPAADGGALAVEGELTLNGETRAIAFDLHVAGDGALGATIRVTQTLWGLKPYSALFGTLKVLDDVEVVFESHQSR